MTRFIPLFFIFCFLFDTYEVGAQDCEVNFDLFGNDTLCTNQDPFELPLVLPFGGTYSGTNVTGNFFDPSGLEPGEYVLTYTVNNETCVGSDDVVMTVIDGVPVTIVGDLELCGPDTAKITSEPSVELTWYDGTKSYFRDFILDTTFTSFASGIDPAGCPFITEFTIEILELPDSIAITGTTSVCPGGEATISVNTQLDIEWFDGSSDPSVSFIVGPQPEYTLTIYLAAECDTTIYYAIEVIPLPEPTIMANTSICSGDSIVITFEGADYFKDELGTITSPHTLYPQQDFTYFIEAYNFLDCFVTIPLDILVSDYPDLNVFGIDEICEGEVLNLEATGGEFYSWLNLDTGEDITQEPNNIFFDQPADTLRFEVTAYSSSECNTIQTFEIPVNPIPDLEIEVVNPFCEGETVSLLASGADNHTWSTGLQDDLLEFIGADDFVLTLYGMNNTGCNDSLTLDVVIHPVPIVTGTGVTSFCEGLSTELYGNGADYYIWNGVFEGDTFITAPTQDSIINLVGYTEFGCTDFTNISINVDPAPLVTITGDDELCYGDYLSISVWSDGSIVWNNGSSETELFFVPEQDTTLSLISTGNNGCTRTETVEVIVHPLPIVSIDGNSTVCAGDDVVLEASGASSYVWNTNQNVATIAITPFATLNYHVTGTSEQGCISSAEFLLTVNPAPYAFFEFSVDEICDLGPDLSWVANPAGGIMSGDGVENNAFNPMNALAGLNTVTYTVTNEFNCSASATDNLIVDDCSGIEESQTFVHSVYPNPASDVVFINANIPFSTKLYSIAGELIMESGKATARTLVLDNLSSGFYMLNLTPENGQEVTTRILVK